MADLREMVANGAHDSVSSALRAGIESLVAGLESDPAKTIEAPHADGWVPVPLRLSPELHGRVLALVAAGRAPSVVELVRGASALLVGGSDDHGKAGRAGQP